MSDDCAHNVDDAVTLLKPLASATTCGTGGHARHRGAGPQRHRNRRDRRWWDRAV